MEKILEEIEQRIAKAEQIIVKPPQDELDRVANDTAEAFIEAYKECEDIIRKHMNNGWIPVKMKFPPQYKEIWVTVERNGETFVATDCVTESGDFQYYDKILAWKEKESMPEPYRPEKGAEE